MAACTSCGDAIDLGDAFCTSCGAKQVSPAEAEAWSGPPEPPVTGAVATVAQAPPSGMSERTLPFTSPIGEQSPSIRNPDLLASDELLGQAAPNTVYLGQRMMYEKEQQLEEFDPLRSGRFVLEMLRRAFVTWLIWVVGLIPVFVVATILGFANHSFGIAVGVLIFLAWCFIMLCAFWLPKLPGQLSEWKFAVDDKGQAAPIVFDHIAWALQRRETPMDSLQLRRFKVVAQGSRDLLEIKQNVFYGLISCFNNGGDLYIGWTFWLYLSPARFLWIGIRRFLWELRNKGHAIYVSVQFDRARALREGLHSAVREGVDVAAGQVTAQGQGTIGSTVPVIADSSSPWDTSDLMMTVTPPAQRL